VADVLLYSTPDSDFADNAVEALRGHKIACYRTGTVIPGVRGAIGEQYSISSFELPQTTAAPIRYSSSSER
jgi:hypothetical protein